MRPPGGLKPPRCRTGVMFDIGALVRNVETMLLVPTL